LASGVLRESFVCPTNPKIDSGTLTETIAVRPSLTSSPESFLSFDFKRLCSRAYSLIIFVQDSFKPSI